MEDSLSSLPSKKITFPKNFTGFSPCSILILLSKISYLLKSVCIPILKCSTLIPKQKHDNIDNIYLKTKITLHLFYLTSTHSTYVVPGIAPGTLLEFSDFTQQYHNVIPILQVKTQAQDQ